MKKLLVSLAAALVTSSAFGQGSIFFATRIVGTLDAPVFGPDGVTGLGAYGGSAQLFLFTGSGAAAAYVPLLPVATFRATPVGAAQAYILAPSTPVRVPNVPGGQQATVVMRAWVGPGYDTATIRGQSNPITITLGGGGIPPTVPASLVGLQGFTIFPEPSTMALGLLGATAFLYRRRK